ncbi:C-5 cytosine-specific DNA methylase family protein [Yersinia pseudotuberculosis IP 32953]|uniref:DNA (cytosine-5-)-methyltransferase n=2 Tax=Yersinia pseudotuberculosis TaxID=633 RepID=Q66BH2_YERPS|nr:DNA cytosine methyltransferase [Yersinia pseudotuberculosis]AJJ55540.1 C-5 cytosine-specific DNA methylase family protein [Yersinia pseudotuberculosis IP 32953]CAH21038.1 putative modification methylase [Yersinia pseudotuberculosis IP 32953]CND87210.1 putative cytosine-specific modification methylase [Yersinia pseudotuberculosis]CNL87425.1 putative cytosine-specific modification methylase [Yersinia pseudotuberculosis]SUB30759.1 DNA (cytosine-5-)-methyltransferase [Yersinia pseudotuberculosi
MKEIIVDNFAGGGGASTGIEMATGRSVDIAINHDPNAIAMHTTNHPDTLHYCESVFDIDPVAATAGRPVGLAWFSPDCRHFSKAKGSKPVKKEIRGLAWILIRWGLAKKPRVVMLENVEEFKTWGPLLTAEDGTEHPDPARAGETFAAFVAMLTTGIDAEHPALQECCEVLGIDINSIDAKRLQAGLGYVVDHKELRASDYGAPTIRKRFFMVMRCDGLPVVWPEPTHGDPKLLEVQSGHRKPWRTAAECIDWSIPCPSIFDRKKPLAENTLKRIARGIQRFVMDNPTPFIVKCNHTSSKTTYDCFRGQPLIDPLQAITKTPGFSLVTPIIARIGQTGFGGDRMAYEVGKPLTTITSKAEHLLVAPIIAREFGNSVGHVVDDPSGTITAGGGGKSRLVSAFLAKHFGGNYTGSGADLNQPAHTVTTVDHHALVTSNLIKLRGTCKDGQQVTQPMPTITAGGLHIGEVRAFLLKYYGNEKEGVSLNGPLHTVTTNDRFGLVTVEGIDYQIVDIGMRMLQPHELYAAQGFPNWYIIDRDYTGTKYAKDKQVARCGNAVPPPFAEALVRANLPEMCVDRDEVAA